MVRNDDAKLFGPGFGKIEAVYRAGAVKHDDGITLSRRVQDVFQRINNQFLADELCHRFYLPFHELVESLPRRTTSCY
jgi:hypothetical protein